MSACIDPFVGKILASWRYDISGLAPEMSGDYLQHLQQCARCHARQRMHRAIDLTLIGLATVAGLVSLCAFVVIRHHRSPHAFWFELGSLALLVLSALVWLLVAIATPAPIVVKAAVKDAAISAASNIHDRLPENIRERIPENIRERIAGESEPR
jgi:hypothetical protein